VLPPWLRGSALASSGSVSDPAGIGSIGHQGNFQEVLTEATPVVPCYQNLANTPYSLPLRSLISRVIKIENIFLFWKLAGQEEEEGSLKWFVTWSH